MSWFSYLFWGKKSTDGNENPTAGAECDMSIRTSALLTELKESKLKLKPVNREEIQLDKMRQTLLFQICNNKQQLRNVTKPCDNSILNLNKPNYLEFDTITPNSSADDYNQKFCDITHELLSNEKNYYNIEKKLVGMGYKPMLCKYNGLTVNNWKPRNYIVQLDVTGPNIGTDMEIGQRTELTSKQVTEIYNSMYSSKTRDQCIVTDIRFNKHGYEYHINRLRNDSIEPERKTVNSDDNKVTINVPVTAPMVRKTVRKSKSDSNIDAIANELKPIKKTYAKRHSSDTGLINIKNDRNNVAIVEKINLRDRTQYRMFTKHLMYLPLSEAKEFCAKNGFELVMNYYNNIPVSYFPRKENCKKILVKVCGPRLTDMPTIYKKINQEANVLYIAGIEISMRSLSTS